ncbi:hypothetical protein [Devosia submarina]|uniref:hypothetical protein n=1 Tax=Devosia submarina TaxID=1173082 RepID=UPI000D3C6495|nr:hypothetical protein [Devosia submarina]
MTETFRAEAQYGDWTGEAAADNTLENSIQALLEKRGQKQDGEILVGLNLYIGDNGYSSISGYLVSAKDADEARVLLQSAGVPEVKKVDIELTPAEFLQLFKLFNVTLSWQGMNLIGRDLNTGE